MNGKHRISLLVLSLAVVFGLMPAPAFAYAQSDELAAGTITTQAKKTYRVVFKSNGGKGSMSAQSIARGKSKALKANSFKRSGYTFNGWNTKANGKGKSYKNKAKVKNLAAAGKTAKLYAQWKKSTSSKTAVQKARDAYKSYLTKHSEIKNFRVINLGGGVPALLVNASFYDDSFPENGGLANSIEKILIYKNGKVKKIGSMSVPGSWDCIHYANHRLFYGPHNHWFNSFRVTKSQSRYEVNTVLYYERSMPLYRGYNPSVAKYYVNGKVKYKGKRAINKYYAELGKCKTGKNSGVTFYDNTEANRESYV